jgi:NAD(P)H-dependent FMN reductase
VGRWFEQRARGHGGFDVEFVDLGELDLPLLDEPNHPRFRQYTKPHTLRWSAMVEGADAFVIVTSEYNHGYPAPLKNAIDFLSQEWRYKPVGFVSYGGVAAGTRAMQQLKTVVAALKMMAVPEAVNIPFVAQFLGDDGELHGNEVMEQAADTMLDELLRVEGAMRSLRLGQTA